MKKYYSKDPRFEADVAYTRNEMMKDYRDFGWDKLPGGGRMSNVEILSEIMSNGIEEAK